MNGITFRQFSSILMHRSVQEDGGFRTRDAVHPWPIARAALAGRVIHSIATDEERRNKAHSMSGFKEPRFTDRQKAAQQARNNLLKKFREQPGPDDPEVARRRAEREAVAANRERVRQEREAAKAEQKRREEEAAAAEAARIAKEKEEEEVRQAAVLAEQKARRDARYAARKSRGKRK
jgi:hypothetical protein